jgi:antitoxin component YwqK of YwqJK toxin-antitoxin module
MNKHKVFLSLLIIIFMFNACKNEKSEIINKYPSGKISRKIPLINGLKEGDLVEYYESGEIKSVSPFVNDRQTGKTVYYFKNGKIQEVQYFDKNVQILGDTSYYEDGKIKFIVEYSNGVKNGYIKKFDSTGTMYFNAKYRMDTLIEVDGVPLGK